MAKLSTMFFFLIIIQASLILFAGSSGGGDLWDFVWNIDKWGSLAFILTLGAIAAGVGLVGISSGSIFGFKTDFLIMGPAIIGLISIGAVFTQLANVIKNELISRVFTSCIADAILDSSYICRPAVFIVAITIGPIAFYYVWTVISWWKNQDYT
jgi:hypothetical protein